MSLPEASLLASRRLKHTDSSVQAKPFMRHSGLLGLGSLESRATLQRRRAGLLTSLGLLRARGCAHPQWLPRFFILCSQVPLILEVWGGEPRRQPTQARRSGRMNGRTILGALLGIALVVVLAGVGVTVYDAGVAQGIAQGGQGGAVAPYPYYGYGPGFRPF